MVGGGVEWCKECGAYRRLVVTDTGAHPKPGAEGRWNMPILAKNCRHKLTSKKMKEDL